MTATNKTSSKPGTRPMLPANAPLGFIFDQGDNTFVLANTEGEFVASGPTVGVLMDRAIDEGLRPKVVMGGVKFDGKTLMSSLPSSLDELDELMGLA